MVLRVWYRNRKVHTPQPHHAQQYFSFGDVNACCVPSCGNSIWTDSWIAAMVQMLPSLNAKADNIGVLCKLC